MESSILRSRQGLGDLVAGLLEVVASERPDLLGPLIEALEHSPAGRGLAQVAEVWDVRPEDHSEDLSKLAVCASKHLDRLEKYRTGWRHPNQMVDEPNVQALVSFALERRRRVPGIARARRLDVLRRKLKRTAETERQRQELDAFLREPSAPIDLAAFMGWRDE